MVSKVPHHAVTVHRDGQNVTPPIGKPFDFTADEVAFVHGHNEHALRDPVNEGAGVAVSETDVTMHGKSVPDADQTKDANVLRRAKAKAGGVARNQGGSIEEDNVSAGKKSLAQEEDDDETL